MIPEVRWRGEMARGWFRRARVCGLRRGTQGYDKEMAAYTEAMLRMGTLLGAVSHDRANQIAFLLTVGRLGDTYDAWSKDPEPDTVGEVQG